MCPADSPSLAKRFSLLPFAIVMVWWARSPALKMVLLMMWLRTSLLSFLGLEISSSSSFMGRFMKAVLVGANTVQGPAARSTG